jgi:hypothetical protein
LVAAYRPNVRNHEGHNHTQYEQSTSLTHSA